MDEHRSCRAEADERKFLMERAVEILAANRAVFHSEADFQHELALTLRSLAPALRIRLERPVRLSNGSSIHMDLMLLLSQVTYAVELKYVTSEIDYQHDGEMFMLAAHSAQDHRRYDILRDLAQVEELVGSVQVHAGCALTLTNDAALWSPPTRNQTCDSDFRLTEGRTVHGRLVWADGASPGSTRGRTKPIVLRDSYRIEWREYSQLPVERSGRFRLLAFWPRTSAEKTPAA